MAAKRPGGLTALAVLNFVFAGFGLLVWSGWLLILTAGEKVAEAANAHISTGVLWTLILLGFVRVGIMIAAGVGYLGQKRFLGRTLGNTYAILSLLDTAIELGLANGKFGIGTLIFLVYPVLTLILLNTTFKDDLVN